MTFSVCQHMLIGEDWIELLNVHLGSVWFVDRVGVGFGFGFGIDLKKVRREKLYLLIRFYNNVIITNII